jgi:hypothetical protein
VAVTVAGDRKTVEPDTVAWPPVMVKVGRPVLLVGNVWVSTTLPPAGMLAAVKGTGVPVTPVAAS